MEPLFLESPLLARAGVRHGFSTRCGGSSAPPWQGLNLGGSVGDRPEAVEENLRRLAAAAGIERSAFRTVRQVHGDRVVVAGEEPLARGTEADAVIAALPGLVAGVLTADCVPILLFEPATGEAAAVHAGWRGTAAAIALRAVEALAARGGDPGRMLAAIGPAIGPCCYEVSPELAADFASRHDGVVRGRQLNLPEANRQLLLRAGLAPERIDLLRRCTSCESRLFFSHRRDEGRTGRQLSFVEARAPRPIS